MYFERSAAPFEAKMGETKFLDTSRMFQAVVICVAILTGSWIFFWAVNDTRFDSTIRWFIKSLAFALILGGALQGFSFGYAFVARRKR
ncbi:hypothetical protein KBC59_03765 [Patescibacteria group bacterium]|nr:hypothetical protein [Patescibacteria group bacterium]